MSKLIDAARAGKIEDVRTLLAEKADPNAVDTEGNTALMAVFHTLMRLQEKQESADPQGVLDQCKPYIAIAKLLISNQETKLDLPHKKTGKTVFHLANEAHLQIVKPSYSSFPAMYLARLMNDLLIDISKCANPFLKDQQGNYVANNDRESYMPPVVLNQIINNFLSHSPAYIIGYLHGENKPELSKDHIETFIFSERGYPTLLRILKEASLESITLSLNSEFYKRRNLGACGFLETHNMDELVDAMLSNSTLISLKFESVGNLTKAGLAVFHQKLAASETLRNLDIISQEFDQNTHNIFYALTRALPRNTSLQSLGLVMPITMNALDSLVEGLNANSSINSLKIQVRELNFTISFLYLLYLKLSNEKSSAILTLDLTLNHPTAGDIRDIFHKFKKLQSLTITINFPNSKILLPFICKCVLSHSSIRQINGIELSPRIKALLQVEELKQQILERQWGRIALAVAAMQANANSALRNSFLSLAPAITNFAFGLPVATSPYKFVPDVKLILTAIIPEQLLKRVKINNKGIIAPKNIIRAINYALYMLSGRNFGELNREQEEQIDLETGTIKNKRDFLSNFVTPSQATMESIRKDILSFFSWQVHLPQIEKKELDDALKSYEQNKGFFTNQPQYIADLYKIHNTKEKNDFIRLAGICRALHQTALELDPELKKIKNKFIHVNYVIDHLLPEVKARVDIIECILIDECFFTLYQDPSRAHILVRKLNALPADVSLRHPNYSFYYILNELNQLPVIDLFQEPPQPAAAAGPAEKKHDSRLFARAPAGGDMQKEEDNINTFKSKLAEYVEKFKSKDTDIHRELNSFLEELNASRAANQQPMPREVAEIMQGKIKPIIALLEKKKEKEYGECASFMTGWVEGQLHKEKPSP